MAVLNIEFDGQKYNIECGPEESILNAMLREDLDPSYNCMAGSCTSCIALLKSGKVEMDEMNILDEDEIDQGKILTCQAFPRTENLLISFED